MATASGSNTNQLQGGFYVDVKRDCPHISSALNKDNMTVDIGIPCSQSQCLNVGENWLCLTCAQVFCSRYVQGHMVTHNENTFHPIALSFSDASVWCYTCDAYIDAPVLHPFVRAVGLAKES